MPTSSTHYSYNIPAVGSDSTTWGTLINEFVNSLSTKLKTVSDAITTAGIGATSTLAVINRNIAEVDNLNARLPAGEEALLPDPYSGATTPVSTWPYLNTELTTAGYSPPTTAQECLDFDYDGFATYLTTRFTSLEARITGLDAPIAIQDSTKLVCEANTILDAIGTYKTVTTTETVDTVVITPLMTRTVSPSSAFNQFAGLSLGPVLDELFPGQAYPTFSTSANLNDVPGAHIRVTNVYDRVDAGEAFDDGVYLHDATANTVQLFKFYNTGRLKIMNGSKIYQTWGNYNLSGFNQYRFQFVKLTNTKVTQNVSRQVKVTIDDVDLSGCA